MIQEMLLNAFWTMFTVLVFGISVIVMGAIGFLLWKQNKQFDSWAVIINKTTNGFTGTVKKCGIYKGLLEKQFFFRLKGSNLVMKADNIPYIPLERGGKLVFLGSVGVRNKVYLQPDMINELWSKVTKKPIEIKEAGTTDLSFVNTEIEDVTKLELRVTEEDLTWALREYGRGVKTFQGTTWATVLPYVMWALLVVGTIVLLAMLLQKFSVLSQVAGQLGIVSENLKSFATYNLNNGTTIIAS